jgi:hypothetical protein
VMTENEGNQAGIHLPGRDGGRNDGDHPAIDVYSIN